jgi:hypothetical protein
MSCPVPTALPVVVTISTLGRAALRSTSASTFDDNVGFAYRFLDIPNALCVFGQHEGIAGLEGDAFTALWREAAAAGNEMAELLLHDLTLPASGAAFPDAGFDLIGTLDLHGSDFRHRLTDWHTDGLGRAEFGGKCLFEMSDGHGNPF